MFVPVGSGDWASAASLMQVYQWFLHIFHFSGEMNFLKVASPSTAVELLAASFPQPPATLPGVIMH